MRKPKKKKTFVLLELLIAFALVSMSILPFLRYPYLTMKKEVNLLFQMELERKAEAELCALFDYAANLNIDYPELFGDNQKTTDLETTPWTLRLAPTVARHYDIVWKVTRKPCKKADQHHFAYVILKVKIYPKGKRGNTALITAESPLIAQKKL